MSKIKSVSRQQSIQSLGFNIEKKKKAGKIN